MPKLDVFFDELMLRGGSDLHMSPGYPPLARVRGDLVPLTEVVIEGKDLADLLLELLTPGQRGRLQIELDIDFAHAHKDAARFRANYFMKSSGLAGVFRLVPSRVLSLAELGCPEVLWRLADRRSGLVLVTGPTGSGKSTTLAAMIDHINKTRACHILTIEDPIEFVHEPLRAQITQREIGVHAGSFAAALKSAARENPDVVLASDLKSNQTVRQALELASTGALVFATVQMNGAAATVDHLVHGFPPDEQPLVRGLLAESLVGVVAQQLLRTADGKGRIAVHEILVGVPQVAQLVREGKTSQLPALMQSGLSLGMQTMDMALERLMSTGKITAEDALERATDKESFAHVVARVRPDLVDGTS
jgi:twitching motility protein PilT